MAPKKKASLKDQNIFQNKNFTIKAQYTKKEKHMPFAKARNEQVHVFLDGNDNNKIEVQVILFLLRHDHEKDLNQVYINIFLMVVAISLHKSRS